LSRIRFEPERFFDGEVELRFGRDHLVALRCQPARDFRPVGSKKKPALVSDNHVLTCTSNDTTRTLKNRTVLINKNIISETVTTQEGQFVDKTVYHRVSER
jgi:hypothetical protein